MKYTAVLIAPRCWLGAGFSVWPTPFFERLPEQHRNETKYDSQIVRWQPEDITFCSSRPLIMGRRYI
jgi:hypothetical protein